MTVVTILGIEAGLDTWLFVALAAAFIPFAYLVLKGKLNKARPIAKKPEEGP